jgi:hypothetical protein
MKVDRTWTITFEEHERKQLTLELQSIDLFTNLDWEPILPRVTQQTQTTIPLRVLERLAMELDIVHKKLLEQMSLTTYQKSFPMFASLCVELEFILSYNNRKSA